MSQETIDYLKKELKFFGFGEKLNEGLESNLKEQPATFQLVHKREFKSGGKTADVEFVLNFKKSEKNEKYYFNNYKATLQSDKPESIKTQTFYTQDRTTAKEAFNLLEGRIVNKNVTGKDEKKWNEWRQLDFDQPKNKYDNFEFKHWHENYGYNLEKAVSKFPIKELSSEEDRTKLLYSLQKGNLTEVTFISEGKEQKMFVSAYPYGNTLKVYDENMKSIFTGTAREKSQDSDTKKEQKESVTPGDGDEDQPAKRSRKRVKI